MKINDKNHLFDTNLLFGYESETKISMKRMFLKSFIVTVILLCHHSSKKKKKDNAIAFLKTSLF